MSSPAYHRPQSHPRAVRAKQRTALHDCHPRSIFRRVLSRLRAVLKNRATTDAEFSATARAICELNDHRRRFNRDACAPPQVDTALRLLLGSIRLMRTEPDQFRRPAAKAATPPPRPRPIPQRRGCRGNLTKPTI